jgi:hypothetical protein
MLQMAWQAFSDRLGWIILATSFECAQLKKLGSTMLRMARQALSVKALPRPSPRVV